MSAFVPSTEPLTNLTRMTHQTQNRQPRFEDTECDTGPVYGPSVPTQYTQFVDIPNASYAATLSTGANSNGGSSAGRRPREHTSKSMLDALNAPPYTGATNSLLGGMNPMVAAMMATNPMMGGLGMNPVMNETFAAYMQLLMSNPALMEMLDPQLMMAVFQNPMAMNMSMGMNSPNMYSPQFLHQMMAMMSMASGGGSPLMSPFSCGPQPQQSSMPPLPRPQHGFDQQHTDHSMPFHLRNAHVADSEEVEPCPCIYCQRAQAELTPSRTSDPDAFTPDMRSAATMSDAPATQPRVLNFANTNTSFGSNNNSGGLAAVTAKDFTNETEVTPSRRPNVTDRSITSSGRRIPSSFSGPATQNREWQQGRGGLLDTPTAEKDQRQQNTPLSSMVAKPRSARKAVSSPANNTRSKHNTQCVTVEGHHGRCFKALSQMPVKMGDHIMFEGDRGTDLGRVIAISDASSATSQVPSAADNSLVIRPATGEEVERWSNDLVRDAEAAVDACNTAIQTLGLPLIVRYASFQYDGGKLTFFYESTGRVDFRRLLTDMYNKYRCRIWMERADELVIA